MIKINPYLYHYHPKKIIIITRYSNYYFKTTMSTTGQTKKNKLIIVSNDTSTSHNNNNDISNNLSMNDDAPGWGKISSTISSFSTTTTTTNSNAPDTMNSSSSSNTNITSTTTTTDTTTTDTTTTDTTTTTTPQGPVCYKCHGTGMLTIHQTKSKEEIITSCKVCQGKGRFPPKRIKPARTEPRPPRTAPGWIAPGPEPAMNGIIPREDEELCSLVGKWKIIQKGRGGHRWSTDDLLTAWVACDTFTSILSSIGEPITQTTTTTSSSRNPTTIQTNPQFLDLGCGIGTVLMMCAWKFPLSTCIGIEAQQVSAEMARRSIMYNGIQHRVTVENMDFRQYSNSTTATTSGNSNKKFHLITGTPPYFGVTWTDDGIAIPIHGGLPTNAQSAPARFEFRGGIEDYISTAARFIEPEIGRIVVCEGKLDYKQPLQRVMNAAQRVNLTLLKTIFIHGRHDKPALFSVHVLAALNNNNQIREPETSSIAVRYKGGKRSNEYKQVIMDMGICPYADDDE
jgi:tRNA1Val (adenine37-N6)-methyltransferase